MRMVVPLIAIAVQGMNGEVDRDPIAVGSIP
jgi:hypothetical protein